MSMNNKSGKPQDVKINCGKSRTKQSFRDAADMNKIIARFKKTGVFENVTQSIGSFADVSSVKSYQEACNTVLTAENAFNQLPSGVRKRFGNDPSQMLDFVTQDNNRDEAEKLGLLKAPEKKSSPPGTDPPKAAKSAAAKEPKATPAPKKP